MSIPDKTLEAAIELLEARLQHPPTMFYTRPIALAAATRTVIAALNRPTITPAEPSDWFAGDVDCDGNRLVTVRWDELVEHVRHAPDCPAGSDQDCTCGAVAFLDKGAPTASLRSTPPAAGEGVIQADRDAAVDYMVKIDRYIDLALNRVRDGRADSEPLVQAFRAHRLATRSADVERDPTRLPANDLTVSELIAERERIHGLWDAMHSDDDFDGHSGSPGEWMVERLDEIVTTLKRAALTGQPVTPTEALGQEEGT